MQYLPYLVKSRCSMFYVGSMPFMGLKSNVNKKSYHRVSKSFHSFGAFISWISHVLTALAEESTWRHVVSTCFHHISIRLQRACEYLGLVPLHQFSCPSLWRFGASGPLLHCVWSVDDASLELDAQSIALYTLSHAMPTALLSTATIPFPGPATGLGFCKAFGIMLGSPGFMLSPAAYLRGA